MKPNKIVTLILTLAMVAMIGVEAKADISNAAVLFLRIAPGARAAGMGEAFVAVADDATATHWNPAGLGDYPLSDSWIQTDVPESYRPVSAIAALKTSSGSSYTSYEIWALTKQGLARYDHKRWYLSESFSTRTSETLRGIISSYFNLREGDQLDEIVHRVAVFNNRRDISNVEKLRDSSLAVVSSEYNRLADMTQQLDSLVASYDRCLVNWDKVDEAYKLLAKGLEDGNFDQTETDRLFFAIEKAHTRFIPETINIPYSAYISGEINYLASTDEFVVIGSDEGLYSYNGKNWRSHNEDENLPSTNITALYSIGKTVLVGTDSGMVRHGGLGVSALPNSGNLPSGYVSALGGGENGRLFAVIDGDLWGFNGNSGNNWSNSFSYKVAIDETPEKIAEQFLTTDTPEERAAFVAKLKELNQRLTAPAQPAMPDSAMTDTTAMSDSTTMTDSTEIAAPEAKPMAELALTPGMLIEVPYVVKLDEKINAIYYDVKGHIWLATDNGVLKFDNREGWSRHGTETEVADVTGNGSKVVIASNKGVFVTEDGIKFNSAGIKGIGSNPMIGIHAGDNGMWYASDSRIVTGAKAQTQLSFMHVKWLPELASDLYYEFFSAVGNVKDWGTFGGNVTFISYGTFSRTLKDPTPVGEFDSFDVAVTLNYGSSLTRKLKGGIGAKIIYSRLSPQGVDNEQGEGTSTGFALDLGLLYRWSDRFNLGLAITNIGPKMAYIDAAQSDDLPRNLAFGFAYKLMRSDYYQLLVTSEINKILVGLDDGFSKELEEMVINSGAEFVYARLFAVRAGYIYDQEGNIKTLTLGVGLSLAQKFKFDFAYIPNNSSVALANTLRVSISFVP